MRSGKRFARAHANAVARSKLLLSAALAALIVAASIGDEASAQMRMMGARPGFGAVRFNAAPRSFAPRGNLGAVTGNGRTLGVVGRSDPAGSSGNSCKGGRRTSCVVNNGSDRPGGRNGNQSFPRGPTFTPPIVTATPPVIMTQPTLTGTSLQPPGPPGPSGVQAIRRNGSGVPPANERRYVPDEVVVELAASTTIAQTDALARRHRLTRLQSADFELGGTTLVRWRIADRRSVPVVVRALESDAAVLSAQPNYLFVLQEEAALPAAPSEGDPAQYMLDKMHLPQAHELATGRKVLVAMIDSGVDVTHPDLAGDIAGTFDALGTGLKAHPHGTAIAGAIAAHGRLMGAAPAAQILAVRAFSGNGNDGGEGTTFAIMSGLSWAVSHGARVVNMSFAGPQDPGIARSLAAAHQKGVALVAAAGNKGAKSPPLFPAADPNVIAVTATDVSDQVPAFANRGRYVAVAAPGVDLMLLAPSGSLQFSSGTSYSAAYVTGTAALMLERRPDLGPDALRQALTGTAHHLGPEGNTDDDPAGAGLVDAYQAVVSVAPAPAEAASVLPAAAQR